MNHELPILCKLVRDKIPEIRRQAGWQVDRTQLKWVIPEITFHAEQKLREELDEFRSAKTRENEIEEIADLLALRDAIVRDKIPVDKILLSEVEEILYRHNKYFAKRINTVREDKKKTKGEFEEWMIILSETRTA